MISFTLPLHLRSAANLHDFHWAQRHRRVKAERQSIATAARAFGVRPITAPLVVTLTRIAPRKLDGHDNLRSAFKVTVDSIADALGLRDDSDARVEWRYEQERGKPSAVRVEIR